MSHWKNVFRFTDDEPRCSTNLSHVQHTVFENDAILVECRLRYSGWWRPVARWKHLDASNRTIIAEYIDPKIENNVSFKLNEELNFQWEIKATSRADNSRFSCEVFFESKQKPTQTTADNVPDYTFSCASETIYVQKYVPRNNGN